MTTTLTVPTATIGTGRVRAARALTGLAARQIRFGAVVVVLVAAGMTAFVAATAGTLLAEREGVESLRALAGNPAIRTLFGEPISLDTVGGFTVWRTATPLAVILAAWVSVTATRITRGEEDAGRWGLLLSGRAPMRRVLAGHLAVLMVVPVAGGAAVTATLAASGAGGRGAAVHGVGLAALGAFFAGTAVLAAQVFAARSAATGTAVGVLGIALLLRMVGDGVEAIGWLRWLSPLGLLELSGPYGRDRWAPLLVLLIASVALYAAAFAAAGRRDVAAGLVASRSVRPARLRLLGSVEGFALRRLLPALAGWALALTAYFLLIGFTAQTTIDFLTDNPTFADRASGAGFELASVKGFAATLFAILALPVGGFVAVRIAAFAEEEHARRVTLLATAPIIRLRLLSAEIAVTAAGAVLLCLTAGVATWLGVLAGGNRALSFTGALAGTLNTLPIIALCLGAAVLALAWVPRAVAALGGLPAAGGFLWLTLALDAEAPAWIVNLSPFAHLASVPLTGVHWTATAVMTALAALAVITGAAGYQRRDLRG
ncbi:ABC transporter permease [Cryptosporangium aurantiacum]|uniref:ABC-2 type transport system permease protein n=1 Tax=Cryptosporangium aurantiacum TaxID=134849 RepID=A0A1M7RFC1_9ACTN|nr:hypothetical protein [Cryptosporangium aurantiacum]SHN44934.1 ABC-2 type transport system permease protein [Cryptosporangium aurantiacum]